jgi:putative FmdB family regulatory protein
MPIYEFRCSGCRHVFEQLCPANVDVAALACPECGGAVARKISMFRFGAFAAGPVDGDTTERSESKGGCSSCATQSCSTCSVL